MNNQIIRIQDAEELVAVIMGDNATLIETAENVTITTGDDLNIGADLLREIKDRAKEVEKKRKEMVDPINKGLKAINSNFKELSEPLKEAEQIIKKKMLPVQQRILQQERERAEIERAKIEAELLKEAERKSDKGLEEKAEELLQKAVSIKAKAEVENVGRGGFSGAKSIVSKRWTYDVVDILAFAKEHPDMIEIKSYEVRKMISAGKRDIAGLKVFQEESISIR